MRISDWSSDVCSSDLLDSAVVVVDAGIAAAPRLVRDQPSDRDHRAEADAQPHVLEDEAEQHAESHQQDRAYEPLDAASGPAGAGFGAIGRASCRERGWQSGYISGGAESFKKTQKT